MPNDRSALARSAAQLAAVLLVAVGALHALWAAGSTWPFDDQEGLARTVVNVPASEMPSAALTLVISFLTWIAALLLLGRAGWWRMGMPSWVFTLGTWGVAAVLFGRALLGVQSIGVDSTHGRLDLAIYSPLCLLLAALAAVVAAWGKRPPASRPSALRSSAPPS
jgi:hypothetical protein